MRRKRDKDIEIDSKAHLSGILYTTRRSTITEKEFTPQRKARPTVGDRLHDSLAAASARRQDRREAAPRREPLSLRIKRLFGRRHGESVLFEKNSRPFYLGVAGGAMALIAAAVLLTSGVLEPRAVEVTVNDAGRIVSATTSESTVGAFFEKNGISLGEGDVLEVSAAAPITEGMEIVIRRAMPLTIVQGEKKTQVSMLAGTVEEAIARANITVAPEDEVYPVLDSYVSAGMSINIVDVDVKTITENETLYYKEITKNDSSLAKGRSLLKTRGENGLQKNTIEVTYKNGVEVSRRTVKEEVVKKPVDEVTLVGSYVAPEPTPTPKKSAGAKASSKPQKTQEPRKSADSKATPAPSKSGGKKTSGKYTTNSDGKVTKSPSTSLIHSGSLSEHKNAPPPDASIIKKTIVMNRITAYAPTGRRTATGVWPKIGTIAANPKQIPYGTKIYVPGYGYGRVEDTGSNKHAADYYCCDLLMESKSDCLKWGAKKNVKVYILK